MADHLAHSIARQIACLKHAQAHGGFASYNTKKQPCPVCGSEGLCHCPLSAIVAALANKETPPMIRLWHLFTRPLRRRLARRRAWG